MHLRCIELHKIHAAFARSLDIACLSTALRPHDPLDPSLAHDFSRADTRPQLRASWLLPRLFGRRSALKNAPAGYKI